MKPTVSAPLPPADGPVLGVVPLAADLSQPPFETASNADISRREAARARNARRAGKGRDAGVMSYAFRRSGRRVTRNRLRRRRNPPAGGRSAPAGGGRNRYSSGSAGTV